MGYSVIPDLDLSCFQAVFQVIGFDSRMDAMRTPRECVSCTKLGFNPSPHQQIRRKRDFGKHSVILLSSMQLAGRISVASRSNGSGKIGPKQVGDCLILYRLTSESF